MSHYVQNLGFKTPEDPAADLNAHSKEGHTQLEAYLLEGAEAGAMTGDPVLLAWFAVADASLAPWWYSNCGDTNHDVGYDCPWGKTLWQVGLGVQATDQYKKVDDALTAVHPGASAQEIGQSVLECAAQSLTFPATSLATLQASPDSVTQGMHNGYWLATLMRDMRISAYLEAPPATGWDCYLPSFPSWCKWYRETPQWQNYSNVLSQTIQSWNALQADWSAALVPDVILDDLSPAFSLTGTTNPIGKGGWRGHFYSVEASSTATVTGTWTTDLPAGMWRVLGFVPRGNEATTPDVGVLIHSDDADHPTVLDQSDKGGTFKPLGEFHLAGKVVVTATNKGTSGKVGFDTIRFHALSLDSPEAGVDGAEPLPESSTQDGTKPGSDSAADSFATTDTQSADVAGDAAAGASLRPGEDDGCGCRGAGRRPLGNVGWLVVAGMLLRYRGRRSRPR